MEDQDHNPPNPFQPTLLNFDDMLNFDTDGGWFDSNDASKNPYNISNFFNTLSSPTKPSPSTEPVVQTLIDSTINLDDLISDISDRPCSSLTAERYSNAKNDHEKDLYDAIEILDSAVSAEDSQTTRSATGKKKFENPDIAINASSSTSTTPTPSTSSGFKKPSPQKSVSATATTSVKSEIPPQTQQRQPRLVKVDHVPRSEELARRRLAKQRAITELENIILTLKRYSRILGEFLNDDGDLVLERYHATQMGILPPEVKDPLLDNPLQTARLITGALKAHTNSRVHSLYRARKPFLWRGSELVILQQAILQSVISRKEFMLYCRYTELLTDMGFDAEDVEKLKTCTNLQSERGMVRIIAHDHKFFGSLKNPIKRFDIRDQQQQKFGGKAGAGVATRVKWYPSPEDLVQEKWRLHREIRKNTMLSTIEERDIDWLFVLKRVSRKLPHIKVDEDTCKRTYSHFLSPKVNNDAWYVDELRRLRSIRAKYPQITWSKVAELLETHRTPFSCFVKYKTHCTSDNNSFANLTPSMHRLVKTYLNECNGDLSRLACRLSCLPRRQFAGWMAPRTLGVVCRLHFNPRTKKGKMSLVEDALLLVVMEYYREFMLKNNGAIESVAHALPWRHCTLWRNRLGCLLTNFMYQKWTLEDDKRLLQLAEEHGPNYKIIQRSFPSKNRKQCRERYLRLQRISKTNMTIEDYHFLYNRLNKGVHLERLNEVVKYLESAVISKRNGGECFVHRYADLEFLKLRAPPTESNLEAYLLTFPLQVMDNALTRVAKTLLEILERVKHLVGKNKTVKVEKKEEPDDEDDDNLLNIDIKGYNRRSFDPNCPMKMASALQVRNAELIPQHKLNFTPSKFELAVYHYFRYFSLRGKLKLTAKRISVPLLDELRQLKNVSRIIESKQVVAPLDDFSSSSSTTQLPQQKRQQPQQPSLIIAVDKNGPLNSEEKVLQELEERKKGGRRKGSKRRKTNYRELKRMAAMTRWQNNAKKKLQEEQEEENAVELESNDSSMTMDTEELVPVSASSSGKVEPEEVVPSQVVVCGDSESRWKSTFFGMISDHTYVAAPPMSPSKLLQASMAGYHGTGSIKQEVVGSDEHDHQYHHQLSSYNDNLIEVVHHIKFENQEEIEAVDGLSAATERYILP